MALFSAVGAVTKTVKMWCDQSGHHLGTLDLESRVSAVAVMDINGNLYSRVSLINHDGSYTSVFERHTSSMRICSGGIHATAPHTVGSRRGLPVF
eukprot:m.129802 g.129802  ORF g.129802 m.129802 type:complete len:95 (+) comp13686_c0_seq1:3104-3388(+)